MLKKMRWRVILAAMLSFLAVIALVAVLVNVVNYYAVTGRHDQTISYIFIYEAQAFGVPVSEAEAVGTQAAEPPAPGTKAPETQAPGIQAPGTPAPGGPDTEVPPPGPFMALPDVESNYMTRFFVVRYDADGNVASVSTDYVASVDEAESIRYAEKVLAGRGDHGFVGEYRYEKQSTDGGTITASCPSGNTMTIQVIL